MQKIEINPIGFMNCPQIYPQQQPRQGFYAENSGYIELLNDEKLIQALMGLESFDYIWVIYHFNKNRSWKPLVSPPVKEDSAKIGVFASRSPYRPNQVGMSVVKLEKIEGRKIFINNFDLLDQTPIIDIKPYISIYDSIEDCSNGWVKDYKEYEYQLFYSDEFLKKSELVKSLTNFDLKDFAFVQLRFNPIDATKKRVLLVSDNHYTIAFRTWRIDFTFNENEKSLFVQNLYSGYSAQELLDDEDKYADKEFHRVFNSTIG